MRNLGYELQRFAIKTMTILGELRRYSSSWGPTAPVLAGAFALNNCCEEPCFLAWEAKT